MEFKPVVPISDDAEEELVAPQQQAPEGSIVDEAIRQTQAIISKYRERLRQCGGESAIGVLLEEALPSVLKMALIEALKKEGDLLTVVVSAMRFYLSTVYLGNIESVAGAPSGDAPRRRRRVADEEDEEEYRQQLMKEVAKQIAAQTIAEYERSRQQQALLPGMEGNPLAAALGQYLLSAMQQRLGSVLGGLPTAQQTPQSQTTTPQQPQQKKKVVDLTEL